MMPFSGHGDRVRPGQNRRAKEISKITELALQPVIDLSEFPNSVVDVFIELPQTDAGTRCAGIVAASMALADAGIPMKDLVCAVSVGKVSDKLCVDLIYDEEAHEDGATDIPISMIPSTGKFSSLQLDGQIPPAELRKALEMAKNAVMQIYEVQRTALKAKYGVTQNDE
jgi:exosome complex component RRP41